MTHSPPRPNNPYCSRCWQLKSNFVGIYPLAPRPNPLSYPPNVPEQRCPSCCQIRPYEQLSTIDHIPEENILVADSSSTLSKASQKATGEALSQLSIPCPSPPTRFSTYSLLENAINSAKSGYAKSAKARNLKDSGLKRKTAPFKSVSGPSKPSFGQPSSSFPPTTTQKPYIFESRLRLLYRHEDAVKLLEIVGSEIWRPDSATLDTIIPAGIFSWSGFLEQQVLRKTGLWQEFGKPFWSNKPPVYPYIEKVTLLSAWNKRTGGDRLPDKIYTGREKQTLRRVLMEFFPETQKGPTPFVYLVIEYSIPSTAEDYKEEETEPDTPNYYNTTLSDLVEVEAIIPEPHHQKNIEYKAMELEQLSEASTSPLILPKSLDLPVSTESVGEPISKRDHTEITISSASSSPVIRPRIRAYKRARSNTRAAREKVAGNTGDENSCTGE